MDKFQLLSSEAELKASIEKDFIQDYMTTVNPFKISTTPEIPELHSSSNIGLYVLYGMGGILIFLTVCTTIYGLIMQVARDEILNRNRARNLQTLRERERTQRANFQEVSRLNTISRERIRSFSALEDTSENDNGIRTAGEHSRGIRETSTPFSTHSESEERFSVRRIREIIRSNTRPKRGMENTHAGNCVNQNQNSTLQASGSSLFNREYSEERMCAHDELNQELYRDLLTRQNYQSFTDTVSSSENITAEFPESLNLLSFSHQ